MQGNNKAAGLLLDKFPEWADTPNWSGQTPLFYCLSLLCRLQGFENDFIPGYRKKTQVVSDKFRLPSATVKRGLESMKVCLFF